MSPWKVQDGDGAQNPALPASRYGPANWICTTVIIASESENRNRTCSVSSETTSSTSSQCFPSVCRATTHLHQARPGHGAVVESKRDRGLLLHRRLLVLGQELRGTASSHAIRTGGPRETRLDRKSGEVSSRASATSSVLGCRNDLERRE